MGKFENCGWSLGCCREGKFAGAEAGKIDKD